MSAGALPKLLQSPESIFQFNIRSANYSNVSLVNLESEIVKSRKEKIQFLFESLIKQTDIRRYTSASDGSCLIPTDNLSRSTLKEDISFTKFVDASVNPTDVFSLAAALFDPIPESILGISKDFEAVIRDSYIKSRVSKWLKTSIMENIDEKSLNLKNGYSKIFQLLGGRNIDEAIDVAIAIGDFKLPGVLSQIGGSGSDESESYIPGRGNTDIDMLSDVIEQVNIWMNLPKSHAINAESLNVWKLICGRVEYWDTDIFLSSQDWKQTFALYFWYAEGGSLSLKQSVTEFLRFYEAKSNKSEKCDSSLQLLRLATDPFMSLEQCFNGVDSLTTWVITSILSTVKERIFLDTNRKNDHFSSLTLDRTVIEVITQLTALDLWEWGIFVATFLSPKASESSTKMLLGAYYPLHNQSGSWKSLENQIPMNFLLPKPVNAIKKDIFAFLTETIHVPAQWVHEARMIQATSECNYMQEIISAVDCKQYSRAQRILITFVGPKQITSGIFRLIKATSSSQKMYFCVYQKLKSISGKNRGALFWITFKLLRPT